MNLQARATILLAFSAFGGKIDGKTLLQKRLYFTEVISGENLGFDFDAHYYGPYSASVNSEVATLKLQGQLREESSSYGYSSTSGFEMKKNSFELTEQGKASVTWIQTNYPEESKKVVEAASRVLKEEGNLNYMGLSFAAKAHWVLRLATRAMRETDIANEATRFGWKIEPAQVKQGVEFLFKTGLVKPASAQ